MLYSTSRNIYVTFDTKKEMLFIRSTKRVLASVMAIILILTVPVVSQAEPTNVIGAAQAQGMIAAAESSILDQGEQMDLQEPKFADTVNLEELSKEAKYVPITTVADLMKEITEENGTVKANLTGRKERNALIGTIGVVNVTNSLNVRNAADGDAEVIGKLYQGSGVVIGNFSGEDGEWMYVYSGPVCGWVVSRFIETGDLAKSLYTTMEPEVATVVADELVVREEADPDSDEMTVVPRGTQFPALELVGDYIKVQVTSYAEGYVAAEHVSLDKGLAAGVKAEDDMELQIDIEVRAETRRILAEQAAAEAAAAEEAERIAREQAEAAVKSQRSSSSSKSSYGGGGTPSGSASDGGSGWTYLGKFRVTFYCKESCGGNTRTASGATATEHYTCATSSQLSFGTTVKVDGYGTWVVQDRGVGYNQIDLYVPASEADGLYYRDVWVQN